MKIFCWIVVCFLSAQSWLLAGMELGGWEAKWGTAKASLVKIDGKKAVKLPCNFKGTKISRASWDRAARLDFLKYNGLRFKLRCNDRSPIARFTLYLKSGAGWYSTGFDIETEGGWSTVTVRKRDTEWEGNPAGWGAVDAIRISAWRGAARDTEFFITDLEYLDAGSKVAVIRGESAAKGQTPEAKAVSIYASNVAEQFEALGIEYTFLSDRDITKALLQNRQVVALAYSPTMPAAKEAVVKEYLRSGGRMICFYLMPASLQSVSGIRFGEHLKSGYAGQFSSIRPVPGNPLGLPAKTLQNTWNIHRAFAVKGRSRVAAHWHDASGRDTGEAAVVVSDNCVFMTHVFIDDDLLKKRELLLAMVSKFSPDVLRNAATESVQAIGSFGPYSSWRESSKVLKAYGRRKKLTSKLFDEAEDLREKSMKLLAAGSYSGARGSADLAQQKMIEAYCSAQPSEKGEFRAFWCHDAFGIDGMNWDQAIKNLADNGFTAIIPNMLWGGSAFYRSRVLPVAEQVKVKGDQVSQCAAACRKYGVECHVWKVCWKMGRHTDDAFVQKMKKEGRVQVDENGKLYEKWLCPSHPSNRKLEIESMLELVKNYDISGIHFDYIRYPGNKHCFCSGCRKRFEAYAGTRVKDWPAGVRKSSLLWRKWQDFRRNNITSVVKSVSSRARKIKKNIKISAAVFSHWDRDRHGVAQDWKLWCDRGYLDFVCPMNYTRSAAAFEQMVRKQKVWAGKVPCYPGIGVSTWSRSGDMCRLIDQIRITRVEKTRGFTIFEYGASEARDVVPLCGIGITSKK